MKSTFSRAKRSMFGAGVALVPEHAQVIGARRVEQDHQDVRARRRLATRIDPQPESGDTEHEDRYGDGAGREAHQRGGVDSISDGARSPREEGASSSHAGMEMATRDRDATSHSRAGHEARLVRRRGIRLVNPISRRALSSQRSSYLSESLLSCASKSSIARPEATVIGQRVSLPPENPDWNRNRHRRSVRPDNSTCWLDGELIASRANGFLMRLLGGGWPDPDAVVEAVRSARSAAVP